MATLDSARFREFRTLRDATVPFGQQTVLVGANNVGKSSVLQALDGCLGVGRRGFGFSEHDIALAADPADGFSILLVLSPSGGAATFSEDEVQTFGMHVDVSDPERQRLFVRVVGRVEDDGVFRTRMRYEKADGLEDGFVGVAERERLGFLLLPAVREGRREFYERAGLWSKIGAATNPSDAVAAELDQLGRTYGQTVVDRLLGEATRTELTTAVAGALSSVLYANQATPSVGFSLLPPDVQDAMREVELRIGTPGEEPERRVSEHSVGTQSVAVVGLFSAYVASVRAKVLALGFEEPEAHLHPHATRALVARLLESELPAILTTHSAAVTDAADPRTIVHLRRVADSTAVRAVPTGTLSDTEAAEIKRRVAAAGSEFLFARVVILAEGPSEQLALPIFARQLGWDLDTLGVSVAPVGGGAFRLFLKLLGESSLDIPHFIVCDNDDAAKTLMTHLDELERLPAGVVKTDLEASRPAMRAAGYFYWSAGALEAVLLAGGAAPYFVAAIDEIWPGRLERLMSNWGESARDDPTFLQRATSTLSKPQIARRVAELMALNAVPVPDEIRELLTAVSERALSEARLASPISEASTHDGTDNEAVTVGEPEPDQ